MTFLGFRNGITRVKEFIVVNRLDLSVSFMKGQSSIDRVKGAHTMGGVRTSVNVHISVRLHQIFNKSLGTTFYRDLCSGFLPDNIIECSCVTFLFVNSKDKDGVEDINNGKNTGSNYRFLSKYERVCVKWSRETTRLDFLFCRI